MKIFHVGLRAQDGSYALAVIRYNYEGSEPENIAIERVSALIQSWAASYVAVQPYLFGVHHHIENIILGQKYETGGYMYPPKVKGFSADTFVAKILPVAHDPQDSVEEKYTLEDKLRDLAALAERERLTLERHAEDIKKRPEFEDEILQRFFEERLKIDRRRITE